jgi:hypothetical protein
VIASTLFSEEAMRHAKISLLSTLTVTLLACGGKPDIDNDDTGEKPNTAPEISSLSISPSDVYTNDILTATVESTDADGDTVTLAYVWYVDGIEVDETGNTLDGSIYFDRDQEVILEVTPSDGTDIGSLVDTGAITILNSAPEATTANISPAVVYTNDTLTATAEATDADGDTVTFSYAWYVDDTLVAETGTSLDGSVYFEKNQAVYVEVTPEDGTTPGAFLASNTVTVSNSTPDAPEVSIDPEEPLEGVDDVICVVDTAAIDDDATDTLSYVFSWTVDGVEWTGSTTTTTFAGDTIGAADTSGDEVWECTASATDGESTGPTASASTTIIISAACTHLTVAALPGWGSDWSNSSLAWSDVAMNSSSYGDCIINSFLTVSSPFTLSDLQATGAEVLLIGNSAGGTVQYSAAEMDAIGDFVQAGNGGVMATYLLSYTTTDNSDLAEWFGVDSSQLSAASNPASSTMSVQDTSHPLATNLASSFNAGGYGNSQAVSSTWSAALLSGASIVMQDASGEASVIAYESSGARGVWVTWMAEYSNTTQDGEQMLYNGLVWAAGYTP